jgi:hypothetical protein
MYTDSFFTIVQNCTRRVTKMPEGRKRKGKHPDKILSATRVRVVIDPGRYVDGNGRYLVVDESGAKRWMGHLFPTRTCFVSSSFLARAGVNTFLYGINNGEQIVGLHYWSGDPIGEAILFQAEASRC